MPPSVPVLGLHSDANYQQSSILASLAYGIQARDEDPANLPKCDRAFRDGARGENWVFSSFARQNPQPLPSHNLSYHVGHDDGRGSGSGCCRQNTCCHYPLRPGAPGAVPAREWTAWILRRGPLENEILENLEDRWRVVVSLSSTAILATRGDPIEA